MCRKSLPCRKLVFIFLSITSSLTFVFFQVKPIEVQLYYCLRPVYVRCLWNSFSWRWQNHRGAIHCCSMIRLKLSNDTIRLRRAGKCMKVEYVYHCEHGGIIPSRVGSKRLTLAESFGLQVTSLALFGDHQPSWPRLLHTLYLLQLFKAMYWWSPIFFCLPSDRFGIHGGKYVSCSFVIFIEVHRGRWKKWIHWRM